MLTIISTFIMPFIVLVFDKLFDYYVSKKQKKKDLPSDAAKREK